MKAPPDPAFDLPRAGLCATCRHAGILRSKRSAFLRCARADQEARYPRYPGLPVLSCEGYETAAAGEPEGSTPGGRGEG